MNLILICLICINAVTFLLYGLDKYKSKKDKWRISEFTLISFAVIGGSAGALLAMDLFRHKTQHKKFRIGLRIILIAQLIAAVILLYLLTK